MQWISLKMTLFTISWKTICLSTRLHSAKPFVRIYEVRASCPWKRTWRMAHSVLTVNERITTYFIENKFRGLSPTDKQTQYKLFFPFTYRSGLLFLFFVRLSLFSRYICQQTKISIFKMNKYEIRFYSNLFCLPFHIQAFRKSCWKYIPSKSISIAERPGLAWLQHFAHL